MPLRVERNATWWADVANHPAVVEAMGETPADMIAPLLERADVLPLASEHGGFIFRFLDGMGRVAELHTLFTPEGWGREVHGAAIEAFRAVFTAGAQVVVTYEMADNKRSRPPRTFGFVAVGGAEPSPHGPATTWILTRSAWLQSPVGRKTCLS